jgi:hypothetical protein
MTFMRSPLDPCLDGERCATDAPASPSWTCSGCGVAVRYMSGSKTPAFPSGWARNGDGLLCLACRREAVRREAQREGADPKEARRAVVRFELTREPFARPSDVRLRTGATLPVVHRVRKELREAGLIPASPPTPRRESNVKKKTNVKTEIISPKSRPRRGSYPERYPAVADELRRDPRRTNPEVARAAGLDGRSLAAARNLVRLVRVEMEAAGEIARWRSKGGAPMHRRRAT